MRVVTMIAGLAALAAAAVSCASPDQARARATTKPVYAGDTGKLVELTYDSNKDGVIDTWVKMDGRCPVSSQIDTNEDGVIDRWEYYEDCGRLVKVGLLRAKPDLVSKASKPDEFVYIGKDGKTVERIEYIEVSNVTGLKGVVRREFYQGGKIVRAEEDTDGDGLMDRWDTFENGHLRTTEFDLGHTGKPGKRFTYDDRNALVLIETEPDASGHYTRRVVPGKKP
jgi:hypothetical protein